MPRRIVHAAHFPLDTPMADYVAQAHALIASLDEAGAVPRPLYAGGTSEADALSRPLALETPEALADHLAENGLDYEVDPVFRTSFWTPEAPGVAVQLDRNAAPRRPWLALNAELQGDDRDDAAALLSAWCAGPAADIAPLTAVRELHRDGPIVHRIVLGGEDLDLSDLDRAERHRELLSHLAALAGQGA